jgi:class 3 adenylate cyclase
MDPPAGTVALLFTDIEGSTRLARALGPDWAAVLDEHRRIVGGAIADHGGWVDRTEGDSFFATFADAGAAARAAVAALRALRTHAWPEPVGELGVRMGRWAATGSRTSRRPSSCSARSSTVAAPLPSRPRAHWTSGRRTSRPPGRR